MELFSLTYYELQAVDNIRNGVNAPFIHVISTETGEIAAVLSFLPGTDGEKVKEFVTFLNVNPFWIDSQGAND